MDICSALPLEILLVVSSYLDLEDLFQLRSVSRSWYNNFTSPDFCLGVIEQHFPSAWLGFAEQLKINSAGGIIDKGNLLKWFQGAAMARLRRRHGRYQSTSVYYYNHISFRSEEEQFEQQYRNGRVAFRASSSGILTRNLRTGQTSRFLQKDRQSILEVRFLRFLEWHIISLGRILTGLVGSLRPISYHLYHQPVSRICFRMTSYL